MSDFPKVELKSGEKPVMLVVLAHPDDETFGMGGTVAYYARRGVQVHLICATRGEVGEMDAEYMQGYATPGDRRESELRCAAEKLGLAEVIFLGYRDSGMEGSPDNKHPQALAAQPVKDVAKIVAAIIRRVKPQVVVTFDPIGGYRHPDHIAMHLATVQAFSMAGERGLVDEINGLPPFTPNKLYYQTIQRGFLKLMVRVMPIFGKNPRKFGKNEDIDLASIAEVDYPTDAVINYRWVADIRDDASACHVSQGGSKMSGGLFGRLRRFFGSKEIYIRAIPARKTSEAVETDLFEGL